jgi:hypothetical protein
MRRLEIVHREQLAANSGRQTGLRLVKKPVRRVEDLHVVREATTGRVVVFSQTGSLPRVWAVAEDVSHPTHDGKAVVSGPPRAAAKEPTVEVAFYRKYTEAMLRRYLRMSTEVGRVPSLLGRELFRGNVSRCKVRNFEDVVIFCHDMERLISKMEQVDQRLIKRVALQQFTLGEASAMLGISLRNSIRLYRKALDHLTWMLLEAGMLELAVEPANSCQERKPVVKSTSA